MDTQKKIFPNEMYGFYLLSERKAQLIFLALYSRQDLQMLEFCLETLQKDSWVPNRHISNWGSYPVFFSSLFCYQILASRTKISFKCKKRTLLIQPLKKVLATTSHTQKFHLIWIGNQILKWKIGKSLELALCNV